MRKRCAKNKPLSWALPRNGAQVTGPGAPQMGAPLQWPGLFAKEKARAKRAKTQRARGPPQGGHPAGQSQTFRITPGHRPRRKRAKTQRARAPTQKGEGPGGPEPRIHRKAKGLNGWAKTQRTRGAPKRGAARRARAADSSKSKALSTKRPRRNGPRGPQRRGHLAGQSRRLVDKPMPEKPTCKRRPPRGI